MLMCFINWSSVINLDLFWKQVFSYTKYVGQNFDAHLNTVIKVDFSESLISQIMLGGSFTLVKFFGVKRSTIKHSYYVKLSLCHLGQDNTNINCPEAVFLVMCNPSMNELWAA